MIRKRAHCIQAAQLVEDVNCTQSISALAPCRMFRKPATAMATALEQIEVVSQAPCKRACLPKTVWEPHPTKETQYLSDVASINQKALWYSPCAERMTAPAADLPMLRAAAAQHDYSLMQNAWLGEVCQASHHLALGFVDDGSPTAWYVALGHWPKSCVLLWPATLKTLGN